VIEKVESISSYHGFILSLQRANILDTAKKLKQYPLNTVQKFKKVPEQLMKKDSLVL
jgi:hypothetical protein